MNDVRTIETRVVTMDDRIIVLDRLEQMETHQHKTVPAVIAVTTEDLPSSLEIKVADQRAGVEMIAVVMTEAGMIAVVAEMKIVIQAQGDRLVLSHQSR